jgi:hypothetical protein
MSDGRNGQRHAAYGVRTACDALQHDVLASEIAGHIVNLPAGSVISVQGPWGRGKTDVVTRVFNLYSAESGPEPIWIDPWQYGRPDLIYPIVVELLSRMRGRSGNGDRLRAIASTLLHAGNAMVFKAVSVFVPFGSIVDAGQEPVDQLIDRALEGDSRRPDGDADPVHEMAVRFRDLVDVVLSAHDPARDPVTGASSKPLLICVDDLDRCLPDHQIAMLEAMHFLTSADANCVFLVAIDPALVQQAAFTHYRTDALDINQYLDKLFQLRLNLTALRPAQIEELVTAEFTPDAVELLQDGLDARPAAVKAAFSRVFFVPELTNPRLVHRVFTRLRLVAAANLRAGRAELRASDTLDPLVAWCAIAERWPQLRQLLQASRHDQWHANINAVCGHYGYWEGPWATRDEKAKTVLLEEAASIISRLPGRIKQPDLGDFLSDLFLPEADLLVTVQDIDAILVSFGL